MGLGLGTTHTMASSFATLTLQSSYQLSAFFTNPFQQRIAPRQKIVSYCNK